jgi:hypothetical protein
MRGLLKYAFLLAIVATGGYFVLVPEDEDVAPSSVEQQAATALLEPRPPAQAPAQASPASIEEEALEYTVAKRVASLDGWREFLAAHPNGVHAQSARAEVERRFGAKGAFADGAAATAALPPPRMSRATDFSSRSSRSQRMRNLPQRRSGSCFWPVRRWRRALSAVPPTRLRTQAL